MTSTYEIAIKIDKLVTKGSDKIFHCNVTFERSHKSRENIYKRTFACLPWPIFIMIVWVSWFSIQFFTLLNYSCAVLSSNGSF